MGWPSSGQGGDALGSASGWAMAARAGGPEGPEGPWDAAPWPPPPLHHSWHHEGAQPGASCATICGMIPTGFSRGGLGLTVTRISTPNSFAGTGSSLTPDCPAQPEALRALSLPRIRFGKGLRKWLFLLTLPLLCKYFAECCKGDEAQLEVVWAGKTPRGTHPEEVQSPSPGCREGP